jgi:hypothetical protein
MTKSKLLDSRNRVFGETGIHRLADGPLHSFLVIEDVYPALWSLAGFMGKSQNTL